MDLCDLVAVEIAIRAGLITQSLSWGGASAAGRGCLEKLEVNVADGAAVATKSPESTICSLCGACFLGRMDKLGGPNPAWNASGYNQSSIPSDSCPSDDSMELSQCSIGGYPTEASSNRNKPT